MKKAVFILFFLSSFSAWSQKDSSGVNPFLRSRNLNSDSVAIKIKALDSMVRKTRADVEMENMRRNMESFMQMQKEREAKQKRNAMIRIGVGLALLAVLVIGLRRRKKAAT